MTEKKSKIYTRSGDDGSTTLFGGARVDKNNPRLNTYGTLDEASSHIGLARSLMHLDNPDLKQCDLMLQKIQNLLFNLGAILACEQVPLPDTFPLVTKEHVEWMEAAIDELDAQLPPLKIFVLPGGHPSASALHVARTVIRRAERLLIELQSKEINFPAECLVFLNRLSDFLFVLARRVNQITGADEPKWEKEV